MSLTFLRIWAELVKHIKKLTPVIAFFSMIIHFLHEVIVFFSRAPQGSIYDILGSCTWFDTRIGLQRLLKCRTTLGNVIIFILWGRLVRAKGAYLILVSFTDFFQRGMVFGNERELFLSRTILRPVNNIKTALNRPKL